VEGERKLVGYGNEKAKEEINAYGMEGTGKEWGGSRELGKGNGRRGPKNDGLDHSRSPLSFSCNQRHSYCTSRNVRKCVAAVDCHGHFDIV